MKLTTTFNVRVLVMMKRRQQRITTIGRLSIVGETILIVTKALIHVTSGNIQQSVIHSFQRVALEAVVLLPDELRASL